MKIVLDTHAHTIVSGHAYNTIREMAQMAKEKGLEAFALTEHAPQMPGTWVSVVPIIIWQVEVPIMASIFPGPSIPTAGTHT